MECRDSNSKNAKFVASDITITYSFRSEIDRYEAIL